GGRYGASLDLLPTGADAGHDGVDAVAVDGLDALGGDRQRDATSLGGHEVAPALDVRIPATVGPTVRVRDGLAETRLPSRYLAMRRHGVVLLPPHVAVARGGERGAGRGPHSERRCHVAGTVTKAIANVQTTARVWFTSPSRETVIGTSGPPQALTTVDPRAHELGARPSYGYDLPMRVLRP